MHCKYREHYLVCSIFSKNDPIQSTDERFIQNFKEISLIIYIKSLRCSLPNQSLENISITRLCVNASLWKSIHCCSQYFTSMRSTIQWILKKDLHLFVYMIQLIQKFKPLTIWTPRVCWIDVATLKKWMVIFLRKTFLATRSTYNWMVMWNKKICCFLGHRPWIIYEKPLLSTSLSLVVLLSCLIFWVTFLCK